ncbi:MAG TPA: helix-turn-helix domain-containing protein [Gemmatimonadaceae bacterium]|jgi:putative transcriptional regulator|nr:helix-turn-helix domain-containing protein [Gemmatimonadaceae bacterium]
MSNRKGIAARRRTRRPMSDALFAELEESVREGGAILRGARKASRTREIAAPAPARRATRRSTVAVREDARGTPDVGALRARFRLSQAKFAALLGISTATLRNWEQGRRVPDGPARVLLRVAARHPDAVLSAVAAAPLRRASIRSH